MSLFDWVLVLVLNGPIIGYGLLRSRDTKTSADWFLAGRSLSWWVVGLSLYATAIDSSDLVADSGGTYVLGFSYFVTNWVGVVVGWVLAAHFIVLPMYRAGMYTNAEYLEARFGPAARVLSALVQVQYRTLILGIIATTLYLVLAIVCDWGANAWWAVIAIAILATIYTALGGLRSVALTDALQTIVMLVASLVLFWLAWSSIGGWSGLEATLAGHEPGLSDQMLHVGSDTVERTSVAGKSLREIERLLLLGGHYDKEEQVIVKRTPAWLVLTAFLIMGLAYSIVNHTQSMRMFGSRSEWDLKMSVIVASVILMATTFTNLMIGIIGRAMYPDPSLMPLEASLQARDSIYPLLVRDLTTFGLKGLVVAGVVAAMFSTFDSIGSTLSSLLVRDVYARLIVRDRDDRHYLRMGQWLTPLIIFGSFLYVPFLLQERGMLLFYVDLVGAFVIPLLTLYLMGVFTRVHRRSGAVALAVGVTYGGLRLLAPWVAERWGVAILPQVMLENYGSHT
ncbi:MAG: sodium/solute symporter, partial [Planctomycetota bacterium]|nr:sodium/solute symporter [Planctomycetota bacterium]